VRIVYAGSPAIAVPALESLADLILEGPDSGAPDLAALLTNADSPRGRRGKPEPTDLAAAAPALERRFERAGRKPPVLLKPERLDAGLRREIEALKPDLLVSFAYGRIFGPRFLALFPLGGINIHPSLLPAYRGPSPIPQAILNGDRETGISVQRLAPEMDCGDILAQEAFPLTGRETTASLSGEMARRAALLLPGLLRDLAAGRLKGRPQDPEKASYCGLLSKAEGRIDWGLSARRIEARIRAYTPWPLSWTMDGERRLYVLEADCPEGGAGPAAESPGTVLGVDKEGGILVQTGEGLLSLKRLRYQDKKALAWRDFLNGVRDFSGRRLA
jgi:methionyl-tRNA formyltransferase